MNTESWMAAFFGLAFAAAIFIPLQLHSISQELKYMNGRVDVRIVNTGFDTTNFPAYNWRLEHQSTP